MLRDSLDIAEEETGTKPLERTKPDLEEQTKTRSDDRCKTKQEGRTKTKQEESNKTKPREVTKTKAREETNTKPVEGVKLLSSRKDDQACPKNNTKEDDNTSLNEAMVELVSNDNDEDEIEEIEEEIIQKEVKSPTASLEIESKKPVSSDSKCNLPEDRYGNMVKQIECEDIPKEKRAPCASCKPTCKEIAGNIFY